MKKIILSIIILFSLQAFSQTSEQQLIKDLRDKDSLFWVGYNTCNLDLMSSYLAKDMEFYHDKGGITRGIDGMKKAMQENICNDKNHKVRRELVSGTLNIYLLRSGDSIYGAIFSGDHYFYNSYNGAKETKDGIAKFSNLWLLKDGSWKMHRILSFDHKGL